MRAQHRAGAIDLGQAMSYETTMARLAARAASAGWRAHRAGCVHCALIRGRGACPCPEGAPLLLAQRSAQDELARSRELDARPVPGQAALF